MISIWFSEACTISTCLHFRFHNSWLRFCCQCEQCRQAHSGQKTFDVLSIPDPLQLSDFSVSSKCLKLFERNNFVQMSKLYMPRGFINPLTPGTFCKKCVFWTFWWFLGWISAKLPLIRSKMRLQHNSLPFLPPASRFSALWLGHVQKSKFWESDLRL